MDLLHPVEPAGEKEVKKDIFFKNKLVNIGVISFCILLFLGVIFSFWFKSQVNLIDLPFVANRVVVNEEKAVGSGASSNDMPTPEKLEERSEDRGASSDNTIPLDVSANLVDEDSVAKNKECKVTGCSNQICSDEDVLTTCVYKESFACYKTASCERQPSGECGFTQTQELIQCLQSHDDENGN